MLDARGRARRAERERSALVEGELSVERRQSGPRKTGERRGKKLRRPTEARFFREKAPRGDMWGKLSMGYFRAGAR